MKGNNITRNHNETQMRKGRRINKVIKRQQHAQNGEKSLQQNTIRHKLVQNEKKYQWMNKKIREHPNKKDERMPKQNASYKATKTLMLHNPQRQGG